MSISNSELNIGPWTEEEHQNFLRGVLLHGRGNWIAIGELVRTRNPQQIKAHAGQHFAQSADAEQDLELAEIMSVSGCVAVTIGDGTATAPFLTPGSGNGFFGDGNLLYDWTGVL